ncbi:AAA domain-containing protein [Pseudomonas berkeleyensis]|uniref:AAA family ATPase n=1 Tax=Pseudomonas berkeleyensis TaxID=2726956 RepID=A0A7G5DKH4_9PSED|nr:AAA domain-containing protein [Pseudomonas berkeleyensis]QMV62249.1 AAA family ATPase [Pseudomonas berkeleyensis]WSO37692.1 AAA domain-containing protein [Pseudomonas berkeleyensis]
MSDQHARQLIGFYRSCYLADSRDLDLDNLGKLPAQRWAWLDGREELVSGSLPLLPLSAELGLALAEAQALYQRELQLVYGVLPVCGRLQLEQGGSQAICGPLFYYEASLQPTEDGNGHLLGIDVQRAHGNWRLLRRLFDDSQGGEIDGLPLPAAALDIAGLGELLAWVERHTLAREVTAAAGFPALASADELAQAQRRRSLSLLPGAFVALVPRGSGSRGIAHELQLLHEAPHLSPALLQLLGETPPVQLAGSTSTPQRLPAQLSTAQCRALDNAARYPLSQISGPPGTGKSYSLAALALDRYLQGESVLLVSRSAQAVRVIAQKLREDFGLRDGVLEGDGQSLRQALRERLERLLQGEFENVSEQAEERQRSELQVLTQAEQRLSADFRERCEQAVRWSRLLLRAERGSLAFWRRWLQVPWVRKRIGSSVRPWVLLDELRYCQQRRQRLSREHLNSHRALNLKRLLLSDRALFVRYNQAIRARNSQRQLALFEDIDPARLLAAFPIWVVTLDELHRLLPLRPELFDVMVMDEATQCDIASALPAFQRCKRAVVTGDIRQLRHISFLSRVREVQLLQRAGLQAEEREAWSYRDNSVLDLVGQQLASQEAVVFLDEHFRSRPALIRFSNEMFYDRRLRVMKERPGVQGCDSLQLQRLDGQRGRNGANEVEVARVLALLEAHLAEYRGSPLKPSVGVLSPFRDQVELIRKRVGETLPLEQLREFRLLVDTPYGFQGEERDLMILSFAIDRESSQAAAYLNRADLFNVAITRARERQVLLFSGDERQLPATHLLRRYLESLEIPGAAWQPGATDAARSQLCEALQAQGVTTWNHYPLAGLVLDIFCRRGDKCLAIDLIGFPGEGEGFLELERYLVLARAGLETLPLSYGLWREAPEQALEALLARL